MWLLPWLFLWRPEAAPCYIDNSSFPSQVGPALEMA